jgi:hypothetical protein
VSKRDGPLVIDALLRADARTLLVGHGAHHFSCQHTRTA